MIVLPVYIAIGSGLGLLYFAGLWFSIRWIATYKFVLYKLLFSFIMRAALLLLALYLIGGQDFKRLISLLIGFTLVRVFISIFMRKKKDYAINT